MLKLALMFTTKHDKIICNQEQRAVFGHLSLLSTDLLYFCLKKISFLVSKTNIVTISTQCWGFKNITQAKSMYFSGWYKGSYFLLPVGGSMTTTKYLHVEVFRPGLWLNISCFWEVTWIIRHVITTIKLNTEKLHILALQRSQIDAEQIWRQCD